MASPKDSKGGDRGPRRRALSSVGPQSGPTRLGGDPSRARRLSHALNPAKGDDPRRGPHRFHAWPARMHPTTAERLLALAAGGEGAILDPFMGGGTVPVECMRAHRPVYGRDINPIALEVAWARTRLWGARRRSALVAAAGRSVTLARELREEGLEPSKTFREAEGRWYDPPALGEVFALARAVGAEEDRGLGRMLRACLSSVLVKASRQLSDSVPTHDRDHRWVPKGRVEQWFVARVQEHVESLCWLSEEAGVRGIKPRLGLADARRFEPNLRGKIDAVLTSPPYPGVYDYVAHHRRRYAALGFDSRDAARYEIGARRDVKRRGWMSAAWRFAEDLEACMGTWSEALGPEGLIFLVIGDGEHEEGTIEVLPLVERAAQGAGFVVHATASQGRRIHGPSRKRERGGGGPPKGGRGREEHIIELRRQRGGPARREQAPSDG